MLPMTPVHTEGYLRVLKLGSSEEKFAPQFVIHTAMIVTGKTADFQGQLPWKQYFGLDYVTALAPYFRNPKQVFQGMDSAAMHGKDFAIFIRMGADSDINHAAIKADS